MMGPHGGRIFGQQETGEGGEGGDADPGAAAGSLGDGVRRAVDIVRSEEARSRREDTSPLPDTIDLEDEVWVRSQSEIVRSAVAGLGDDERALPHPQRGRERGQRREQEDGQRGVEGLHGWDDGMPGRNARGRSLMPVPDHPRTAAVQE